MDVKEKLKEVIQENVKALNNNDFTTVYKAAYNKDWYSGKVTTLLTEFFIFSDTVITFLKPTSSSVLLTGIFPVPCIGVNTIFILLPYSSIISCLNI